MCILKPNCSTTEKKSTKTKAAKPKAAAASAAEAQKNTNKCSKGCGDMAALDRAVECIRALVKTNAWDYCIVWKLGDDPSSFIEWRGCCCSGSNGELVNAKEESGKDQFLISQCRDEYVQHPIRTEACEKLAKFPSSIPLYSGIHGEVVMSNQARWLANSNNTTSSEANGTHVLVPIAGGLVELFSSKQVAKNQQIIDFILVQYISIEQESLAAHNSTELSVGDKFYKPFLDEFLINLPTSIHDPNFISNLHCPHIVSKSSFYPSFEGSSTGSNLPKDYKMLNLGSGCVSSTTSPEKSSGRYPGNLNSTKNKDASFGFANANWADEDDKLKGRKKTDRENYQSKNLITERNRRQRINNGLLTLRSLVPNISKMDKAATLGDAYDYIQELEKSVKMYQDELRDLAEDDCKTNNPEQEFPKLFKEPEGTGDQSTTQQSHNQTDSNSDYKKHAKVEIEVSQIGARDFLVKIICTSKRGGFFRLMQAMDSSGLQVIDANVTTFNGSILNILRVEAFRKEIHLKTLKDSLMELIHQDG